MMQSITFECEVITPMFLAGADGTTPELRPPSIKGALRFWWRALNGHLPLHDTYDEKDSLVKGLKSKEDEIFGGTDGRSKVILTTRYADENMNDENVPKFNYRNSYKEPKGGIKYFHVFFYEGKDEDIKNREGIAPGIKFNVKLRSKDKVKLIEAADAFWVMSLLGGIGTRSRRGDGSFKINKISSVGLKAIELACCKKKDEKIILQGIEGLKDNINLTDIKKETNFSTLKNADIFYSKGNGFSTWYDAIADIAHKMMLIRDNDTRFKKKSQDDKFKMTDMDKKAAFGLPINVRPPLSGTVNLYNSAEKGYEASRRASPLSIVINKIGKNYYWTITFLQGVFMPNSSIIKYEKNGEGNPKWEWDKEDQTLVNEFRNKLIDDWGSSNEDWEAEVEAIKNGTKVKKAPKVIKHIKL